MSGQVLKRSLPLLSVPTEPTAPDLKRLDLPQGQLAQLCPSDLAVRYIAVVELKEGGIRGNHYHDRKEEWFYLMEGEVELLIEDRGSKERCVLSLGQGDMVVIKTGVAHALRPLGPGQALEFSPAAYDEGDTMAYSLD